MTPANETRTVPGRQYSLDQESRPVVGNGVATSCTRRARFEDVKDLLADRPLHRPNRTLPIETLEDMEDLQAFRDRQNEPGIPWEQIKRELGL